jgi:hypothetical protein
MWRRARGEADEVRSALGTGLRLCLGFSATAAAILIATAGPVARLMRQPALETALRIMAPAAIVAGCTLVLVQASLASKVTRANFYVRGLGEPIFLLLAGLSAALVGRSLATLAVAHVVAATAFAFRWSSSPVSSSMAARSWPWDLRPRSDVLSAAPGRAFALGAIAGTPDPRPCQSSPCTPIDGSTIR